MLGDNISAEIKRKLAEASDTPAEVWEELSKDSDRPCLLRHNETTKLLLGIRRKV